MVSEFGSLFRFMGVPNISQAVIPEKDLINDMEFSLHPVRSSSSSEEKVEEGDEQQEEHKEKRRRPTQLCVPLKIQIPSSYEEEKGGLKTPTSRVHRISMQKCPAAPRKPKSIPLSSTKRKAISTRPRFLLDLSKEIESLFPRPIVLDLGGKIKKVKQAM